MHYLHFVSIIQFQRKCLIHQEEMCITSCAKKKVRSTLIFQLANYINWWCKARFENHFLIVRECSKENNRKYLQITEDSFYFAAETAKIQKLTAAFTFLRMDCHCHNSFLLFLPIVSAFWEDCHQFLKPCCLSLLLYQLKGFPKEQLMFWYYLWLAITDI